MYISISTAIIMADSKYLGRIKSISYNFLCLATILSVTYYYQKNIR